MKAILNVLIVLVGVVTASISWWMMSSGIENAVELEPHKLVPVTRAAENGAPYAGLWIEDDHLYGYRLEGELLHIDRWDLDSDGEASSVLENDSPRTIDLIKESHRHVTDLDSELDWLMVTVGSELTAWIVGSSLFVAEFEFESFGSTSAQGLEFSDRVRYMGTIEELFGEDLSGQIRSLYAIRRHGKDYVLLLLADGGIRLIDDELRPSGFELGTVRKEFECSQYFLIEMPGAAAFDLLVVDHAGAVSEMQLVGPRGTPSATTGTLGRRFRVADVCSVGRIGNMIFLGDQYGEVTVKHIETGHQDRVSMGAGQGIDILIGMHSSGLLAYSKSANALYICQAPYFSKQTCKGPIEVSRVTALATTGDYVYLAAEGAILRGRVSAFTRLSSSGWRGLTLFGVAVSLLSLLVAIRTGIPQRFLGSR